MDGSRGSTWFPAASPNLAGKLDIQDAMGTIELTVVASVRTGIRSTCYRASPEPLMGSST